MAVPFDQRPDLIWFDGELVPTSESKISVLTHGLHYASCVFEGERAYGGTIYKGTEHSERLKRSANILDFEIPYSVAEIDAAKRLVLDRNNQKEAYVRADRLARLRAARRLGAAEQDPPRDRDLGMAELFRPGAAAQGHPARSRRIPPPRSGDRAVPRQGRRPLHDLHHLQAPRRAQRLCRRHDARLAGPRRRMHRRQHLLHQGRQDPHADRRLLPRRHHARDRDHAGEEARHRGDRAPHHAGRAVEFLRNASSPAPRPK